MEKQTKSRITREEVAKELRACNATSRRSGLILCGAGSLLCIPLTVGLVYGIWSWEQSVWLKILWTVLIGGMTSAPVWVGVISLREDFAERKWLQNGEFVIVTRTLSYKSEKYINRHIEEYLHFADFREISVEHTLFQLASNGDEFYLVHYKNQKKIQWLYPAKMYEYKEE